MTEAGGSGGGSPLPEGYDPGASPYGASLGERRVVHREGCPLHAWVSGPRHAPAVVFTHGVLMDHRLFDAVVLRLRPRFRVVTWDVRGHGRSRPGGADFSIAQAALDLEAIMNALEVRRAVLVGHSMGGFVAQELALRAPDRVRGLVMAASACVTDPVPPWLRLGIPLSVLGMRLCPPPLLRYLVGFGAGTRARDQRFARTVARPMPRAEVLAWWRAVTRAFRPDPAHRSPLPVLVIYGDRDNRVAFGALRLLGSRWARRHPDVWHRVLPGLGHNFPWERPEVFARELLAFLDALPPEHT